MGSLSNFAAATVSGDFCAMGVPGYCGTYFTSDGVSITIHLDKPGMGVYCQTNVTPGSLPYAGSFTCNARTINYVILSSSFYQINNPVSGGVTW